MHSLVVANISSKTARRCASSSAIVLMHVLQLAR